MAARGFHSPAPAADRRWTDRLGPLGRPAPARIGPSGFLAGRTLAVPCTRSVPFGTLLRPPRSDREPTNLGRPARMVRPRPDRQDVRPRRPGTALQPPLPSGGTARSKSLDTAQRMAGSSWAAREPTPEPFYGRSWRSASKPTTDRGTTRAAAARKDALGAGPSRIGVASDPTVRTGARSARCVAAGDGRFGSHRLARGPRHRFPNDALVPRAGQLASNRPKAPVGAPLRTPPSEPGGARCGTKPAEIRTTRPGRSSRAPRLLSGPPCEPAIGSRSDRRRRPEQPSPVPIEPGDLRCGTGPGGVGVRSDPRGPLGRPARSSSPRFRPGVRPSTR